MAYLGYIRLPRKFFQRLEWKTDRVFSDFEALLDIYQSARFDHTPATKKFYNRYDVTWHRGQLPASIRQLARRWKWSPKRVYTFLSQLTEDSIISTDTSQGIYIITVCEYDILTSLHPRRQGVCMVDETETLKETPNSLSDIGVAAITETLTETHNKKKEFKYISNNNALAREETDDLEDSLFEKLPSQQIWIEAVCRRFRLEASQFPPLFDAFRNHCLSRGDKHSNLARLKSHFVNWCNKQTSTPPQWNEPDKANKLQRRGRTDLGAHKPDDYSDTL